MRFGSSQPFRSVAAPPGRQAAVIRPFALAEERAQLTAVPEGARRPARSVQETAP
jgi:hypothetical protein